MKKTFSYKASGVDIEKGRIFVEKIQQMVGSMSQKQVHAGIGGFAALYNMGNDRFLAAGTDGVGTKLQVAQCLNKHDTIGIDLVAMSVNDILCTGARPLFFLDYLSCGKLDLPIAESIIQGIIEGCKQSEMALIGGETAEMPGMYRDGEYDLAGFCVGEVLKDGLIDGRGLCEGMEIVGLASSGIHANGLTLARTLIAPSEEDLLREALTPTKIYWDVVKEFKKTKLALGLAHITGGGLENIPRISNSFDYRIKFTPSLDDISPLFKVISNRSQLSRRELYQTFNMGVGFVVISHNSKSVQKIASDLGIKSWILGEIQKGSGSLIF